MLLGSRQGGGMEYGNFLLKFERYKHERNRIVALGCKQEEEKGKRKKKDEIKKTAVFYSWPLFSCNRLTFAALTKKL